MTIVLIRIAACIIVLVIPFALLALASGKAEGMIWFIFPVVLAAPALFLLAIIFAPVEALAAAAGISKNLAVALAGVIGGAAIWLSFAALNARAQGKPVLSLMSDGVTLRTTLIWMALGLLLAGVWRGSEWLAKSFGWLPNG